MTTTTQTQTKLANSDKVQVPIDVARYPKLSREQAGHLRHFHNLASQLDGQWHHMGGQEPMQDFVDAYRYQLATMSYATALAHYHRLPALRSVFKTLLRRLILKMLRREVWGYWFLTSHSGKLLDPSLTELRKPWADPVVRENIMYSGHLLLMVSLYSMLFDNDEFEREGSLLFDWDPLFWGLGPEAFSYSTKTLQEAIMREMNRTGYMGVCCEPNMVFIVCNQFPIIGIRLNDVRHGTNEVGPLLDKYTKAWKDKGGFLGGDGQFLTMWQQKQDFLIQRPGPSSAWTSAFMNTWNSDFVNAIYDRSILGFVTNTPKYGIRMQPLPVGLEFRRLVDEEGLSPNADETVTKAKEAAQKILDKKAVAGTPKRLLERLTMPTYGYIVKWLSELGKTTELEGILKYSDENLRPTWDKGGLFYPREDAVIDDNLDWKFMDPFTGNGAIGYARLNVPNGMKKIYEEPWTSETLATKPYLDGVELGDGVDFLRGVWDDKRSCLVFTMRTWDAETRVIRPIIKNLGAGTWNIYVNGTLHQQKRCKAGDKVELELHVDGEESDLVLVQNSTLLSTARKQ